MVGWWPTAPTDAACGGSTRGLADCSTGEHAGGGDQLRERPAERLDVDVLQLQLGGAEGQAFEVRELGDDLLEGGQRNPLPVLNSRSWFRGTRARLAGFTRDRPRSIPASLTCSCSSSCSTAQPHQIWLDSSFMDQSCRGLPRTKDLMERSRRKTGTGSWSSIEA